MLLLDKVEQSPGAARVGTGRRPRWFAVRKPLSARASFVFGLLAFVLPLLSWSVVSYVPFVWHPEVIVLDAGDPKLAGQYNFLTVGERVDRDVFEKRNAELAKAGRPSARGVRANPIFLPAPHEVGKAFYTAFTTPPARTGDFWLHESLLQSCKIIFWGFVYSALQLSISAFAVRCPPGRMRKSFAAYYYTKEPPPGWDGVKHSTVFRARPDEYWKGTLAMPAENVLRSTRATVDSVKSKVRRLLSR